MGSPYCPKITLGGSAYRLYGQEAAGRLSPVDGGESRDRVSEEGIGGTGSPFRGRAGRALELRELAGNLWKADVLGKWFMVPRAATISVVDPCHSVDRPRTKCRSSVVIPSVREQTIFCDAHFVCALQISSLFERVGGNPRSFFSRDSV